MRRLLQKQTQSLQTAKVLAKAMRSDIPQSGLDPIYNQTAPQIIIQQSGFEQPSPIAPTAAVQPTVPGQKDPITEELKRLDADVKRGLLDKTGDGANANIIKLGEQIKKAFDGLKNASAGIDRSRIGARDIQYDDERLSAIRMQGERYIPGMRESLGFGERGAFSGLKNLFSLSPLKDFKMEDIDERSLFGGAIKRKMAESQYATDQLAMAKTLKGDLRADVRKKKEYQDEDGQFSEKIFRQRKIEQFREQNRLRGEIGKTIEEIDRLKHDQGYTDEQIKKTGLYKTLQQQERELSAADPDRFARDVKEAKKKDIESQRANIKTTPLAASVKSNDVAPDVSGMDVSEKESEQMLVVSQQIGLLKQIEENTRPLKGLASILKSAMGATGGGSGGRVDDGGGFDLGGLGDGPDRRQRQRGRGIGSKLKQLGKGAISLGAKGARAALPYALPAAIAYGAARTIDYGASVLGVGDVEIDEAQDEVNWQKMSTGQKIGSGIARGIESVGNFLGLESFAKEAEVSRIEKETKMVGKQIQASGDSDQTIQTDIKFKESIEAADAGSEKRQQLRDLTDRAEMSWHGELERRKTEQVSLESIEPPQDIGGKVYQESDELKSVEKRSTQQSEPVPNIINAPTTNVNQTTNNVTRPPARNTDSTYREYSKSRFAW